MRNSWKCLLVMLMLAAILCGCGGKKSAEAETTVPTGPTEATYPYDFTSEDFFYIKDCLNYIPSASVSGVKDDGSFFN